MTRSRAIVALLTLVLALPSAAFAQGAGDEQYQDPFGDEQAQDGATGRGAQDEDGLSDEPPVDDDGGNGGGEEPAPPDDGDDRDEARPADDPALPNTGSDPRLMAYAGLLLVLVGVGLRLRTIDPDEY